MTPATPLPLAPRPFPDESIRSWIGRIAARYDLESLELVARLRGSTDVDGSRVSALDWMVDAELETLLARAARLDRSQISALRVPVRDLPPLATWHRQVLAWCSACVREDIARYGETYERGIWRLGCCAACPTHSMLLEEICLCVYGRCRFRPVAGRLRLVCEVCRRPADALQDSLPGAEASVVRRGELLAGLALDLQADWLGAITGAAPTGPWQFNISASRFAAMVRDLAAAVLWPAWFHCATAADESARPCSAHFFAGLDPRTGLTALGTIASVLAAAAGGSLSDRRFMVLAGRELRFVPAELVWFVQPLPADVRRWLRAAAQEWAPILAQNLGSALDIAQRRVRDAQLARDQAGRNAVGARDAAVKRIAARAGRRAVARAHRPAQGRGAITPEGVQAGPVGAAPAALGLPSDRDCGAGIVMIEGSFCHD
jgi:hypothetical protein